MTIGEALRDARKAAGLSQAELGRRMGTTQSAVARAENDAAEPSIAYVRRVAAATGEPITLSITPPAPISAEEARRRWEIVGGGRPFDPWSRNPEPAEARQLRRAGVKRG
jgi:transcriptional regulator with XRE-family HTH domain